MPQKLSLNFHICYSKFCWRRGSVLILLFNMYTQSTMRVKWNNSFSDSFPLLNGTRQDSVISATLYTVHIDELLRKLKISWNRLFHRFHLCMDIWVRWCMYEFAVKRKGLHYLKYFSKNGLTQECWFVLTPGNICTILYKYKILQQTHYHVLICVVKFLCVKIITNENYLGNKLFNNIYKGDMSEFVRNFYKSSNSVIANFTMCESYF